MINRNNLITTSRVISIAITIRLSVNIKALNLLFY